MTHKRIISLTLAAVMAGAAVPGAARDFRNGCTLKPLCCDETGVLPDSGYILTGSFSDAPELVINGTDKAEVTRQSDGSWLVMPETELEYNSLYTFTLSGESTVSWTFETAERFAVTGVLPGRDAYNVPINSGIEITFSHEDFDLNSVKAAFSIKPAADGTWQKHKNTAVFVPSASLAYGTSYTVTLGADVKRGDETLTEGMSFEFTTEYEKTADTAVFYVQREYMEVTEGEVPSIPIAVYGENVKLDIKTEVFGIDGKSALEYLTGEKGADELYNDGMTAAITMESSIVTDDFGGYEEIALPSALKNGFSLIRFTADGKSAFTLIQCSDIGAKVFSDTENHLIWLNSFATGGAIANADIKPGGAGAEIKTDENGLAYVPKGDYKYIEIDADGKTAYYPLLSYDREINRYRSTAVTDRTLYKPEDTVYIWGAARDFETGAAVKDLKAELYSSGWYNRETPILTADLNMNEYSFDGKIELPSVGTGSYYVRITDGENVITSVYFTVEKYVKPAYEMTVTPDKQAIFLGDSVSYTVNTAFFEGTSVPELTVSAASNSWRFGSDSFEGTTDSNGSFSFDVTPTVFDDVSGYRELDYELGVYATLPEGGDISAVSNVRVFTNDIRIEDNSEYSDGVTHIRLHSDTLTTERINNGTAESYFDYIGSADAGRDINAEIYRVTYERRENGSYYDYKLKQRVPMYDYERIETLESARTITTDSSGDACCDVTLPEADNAYYIMRITAADGAGRAYTDSFVLPTDDQNRTWLDYYSGEGWYASTNKEKYALGDTAEIKLTYGMEQPNERVLMIKDYNGIKETAVSENAEFSTEFTEIPRAYLRFYVFDKDGGYDYILSETLEYDTELSRLTFEVSADKESYAPGEECVLKIKALTPDGAGADADINVNVVDEALLALADNDTDILSDLYSGFYRTVSETYTSHSGNYYYAYAKHSGGSGGDSGSNMAMPELAEETASSADMAAANNGAAVRSDFKDTALFFTAHTDDSGEAEVRFTLPDNITSWRAAINGVTTDLLAGGTEYPITVTMPQFINSSMSESYIAGDTAYVGVNLYGSGLTGGEVVKFEAARGGEVIGSGEGKAFERVNLPLGEMTESGAVTVTAYVDGTAADSIELKYEVTDTYNKTPTAVSYDSPYDAVKAGESGNVRIIFTDKNRGGLLPKIYRLRQRIGDRLDQRIAIRESGKMLEEYYGIECSGETIDFSEYQDTDGGLRLFPYGDSDLGATAKLTKYIKDDIDVYALRNYLYDNKDEVKALYALACLREPVMGELAAYAAAENLKASDSLYIALAYCELGEYGEAEKIFNDKIVPISETTELDTRVVTGTDSDDILEATALAAVVGEYIGNADAEKYESYCTATYSTYLVTSIEELMYLSAEIKTLPTEGGEVTYTLNGETETIKFSGGECRSLIVPAKNIAAFAVNSASESVRMTSVSEEKLNVTETENDNVGITRTYTAHGENTTELNANDIVKVTLKLDFGAQARSGGYVVTDYLPSGLTPVSDTVRSDGGSWYLRSDGQRVTLYANNGYLHDTDTVTYYARVVAPGTYTADNATVQYAGASDVIAATDRTELVIR